MAEPSSAARGGRTRSWAGAAFIVEALVLLVFLTASLAVMFSLFVQAYLLGTQSKSESTAIQLGSNVAEIFAADPTVVEEFLVNGDYAVRCSVQTSAETAGTLYYADIVVCSMDDLGQEVYGDAQELADAINTGDELGIFFDNAPVIYELQTARYLSEVV